VAAAGAFSAVVILAYVALYGGRPAALICADREKIGQWPFEAVDVGFAPPGFDGQFYYALARSPWHRCDSALDSPAYRHARIVYPALAWLLSGGDPRLLLWVLPAVNWLALVGLAGIGAAVARHYGRTPWWGLILPLMLNATTPALRNLTDPIAMATACAVVAAWVLRWQAWTLAPLAALAIFSREQNLVIVGLVILESVLNRRFRATVAAGAAVGLFAVWVLVLHSVYGAWPVSPANTEAPFAGFWYRVTHMTGRLSTPDSFVNVFGVAMIVAQALIVLKLVAARADRLPALIALAGAALAAQGGTIIYADIGSYTRVFWWMPFGIWLWAVQTGRTWPGLLAGFGLLWPAYALAQAWHKMHTAGVMIVS
jgi:hypothetical protein